MVKKPRSCIPFISSDSQYLVELPTMNFWTGASKGDDFDDEWDFELEDSLNLDDETEIRNDGQNTLEKDNEVMKNRKR